MREGLHRAASDALGSAAPILREHLFDRVAERQIPAEDLYKLKL